MKEADFFSIVRHVDYTGWLKIERNEEFDAQPTGLTTEREREEAPFGRRRGDGEGACTCAGAGGGRTA